ncbi:hypothetical protein [Streptomyces albidoflavus]|uniref:hypothetical protein n=1 Tax=Streptomyces albidoflavus TaxID=1886 RepID=UPI00315DE51E
MAEVEVAVVVEEGGVVAVVEEELLQDVVRPVQRGECGVGAETAVADVLLSTARHHRLQVAELHFLRCTAERQGTGDGTSLG